MTVQGEPTPLTDEARARIYNWAAERVTIPHSSPARDAAVLLLEQREELALMPRLQALVENAESVVVQANTAATAALEQRDDALARLRLAEATIRELREALEESPCKCDMRYVEECPDCGSKLERVPQDTRLNWDQWDAVKAGDFFCTHCASDAAPSGHKYWRFRHLAQRVNGDTCSRCRAIAGEPQIRIEVMR